MDSIYDRDREEGVVEEISETQLREILRIKNKKWVIKKFRETQVEGEEKQIGEVERRRLIGKYSNASTTIASDISKQNVQLR